ncbi:MAG: putative major facilitator superfamily transporter [Propionibacteriaceae bacterium]|jgi:MFS family permease|nr:putative major facilitator superfamily transporter [Propionibacteriaceae bacterium]
MRSRVPLPRDVVVLGLIAFCVAVGFGVLVPVLPVFARSFGVGNLEVGAVVSVFALMRLVSSPWCGWMISLAGERVVLATGIFIVAMSSGLAGIAASYSQLLLLRGIGGIGSAMFTVSAMTLLLGSVPVTIRGRAAGFYQGGFLIGGMAGPAVGGLLAAISITAPFFFYAGTLAVAGVVGLVLLRGGADRIRHGEQAAPIPFRQVLRDSRYQAACLCNLAQGWSSFGVRSSLVPVLVVEVLHRPTSWTGAAFACASVAQTIAVGPAGRFVDTVGRKPAIVGGSALAAVSIFAVPFVPDIGYLIVALCAYGVASAFLGTAPAASVGDAAGGRGGTAVAVFSMCADVGAIVGPLVAGLLADRVSYPVAFGVGAALLLTASLYALRMPGGPPHASDDVVADPGFEQEGAPSGSTPTDRSDRG